MKNLWPGALKAFGHCSGLPEDKLGSKDFKRLGRHYPIVPLTKRTNIKRSRGREIVVCRIT